MEGVGREIPPRVPPSSDEERPLGVHVFLQFSYNYLDDFEEGIHWREQETYSIFHKFKY